MVINTDNCPNSTPILKASKDGTKSFLGNPYSLKTTAKPKPCNNPKPNTMNGRHLVAFLKIQFYTATQIIESAIRGSTISAGTCTKPKAANANVMV